MWFDKLVIPPAGAQVMRNDNKEQGLMQDCRPFGLAWDLRGGSMLRESKPLPLAAQLGFLLGLGGAAFVGLTVVAVGGGAGGNKFPRLNDRFSVKERVMVLSRCSPALGAGANVIQEGRQ